MISFSPVFVKLAHVSPAVAGFYRVFIGGMVLLLMIARNGQKFSSTLSHFMLQVLCGFFLFLDLLLWHVSIHYIGPGLSTILTNFQVFLLAGYGAAIMGERITTRLAAAIVLAIAGLFLLVGIDWGELQRTYKLGILIALGAAAGYAAYILLIRRLQTGENGLEAGPNLASISLVCASFFAVDILRTGDSFNIPDLQSLGALAAYGVLSQVVAWVLISRALPRISTSHAGLLLMLQPSLAFCWDILLFGRHATAVNLLGAAITLSAIYLGATANPSK